jgi:hypothetical protein
MPQGPHWPAIGKATGGEEAEAAVAASKDESARRRERIGDALVAAPAKIQPVRSNIPCRPEVKEVRAPATKI